MREFIIHPLLNFNVQKKMAMPKIKYYHTMLGTSYMDITQCILCGYIWMRHMLHVPYSTAPNIHAM